MESVYAIIKPVVDAHTMGIMNCKELLEISNKKVIIAPDTIARALDYHENIQSKLGIRDWLIKNHVTDLILSYRLDPHDGLKYFAQLMYILRETGTLREGYLRNIYFGGLPETCDLIVKEYGSNIKTFRGDENGYKTLKILGLSEYEIPKEIILSSEYDNELYTFGNKLLESEKHHYIKPNEYKYSEYNTSNDNILHRIKYCNERGIGPVIRAHAGPFIENREKALIEYSSWLKDLAKTGYLDVMSVGSSQLSQSNFGENWDGMQNGGGVPFNSTTELAAISEDSRPMLVRAYSGTKSVRNYAEILDKYLHNAWHALSIWWFNQMDGRGPLCVKDSIKEHFDTISYIGKKSLVFEPNVSHHFSFRGADEVSYIVTAYLAMRLAKLLGVRYAILQNMLNTPKTTWFTNDIVKSRVLLKVITSLEDKKFKVFFQPRAGLDYFVPNIDQAKTQLAAISALMSDIRPQLPDIVHVVSYSEAMFLATPPIINDSIKIVKAALKEYPRFRKAFEIKNRFTETKDIIEKEQELYLDVIKYINFIEQSIPNLYSPEGFYSLLKKGYFPLPYLWKCKDEFSNSIGWEVRNFKGSPKIVDSNNNPISTDQRINMLKANNI